MNTHLVYLSLAAAFWAVCGCQSQRHHASNASLLPREAAAERIDLGKHHFKVSTTSREAQRAFDRGLTLAYGFSHRAAMLEFQRAAELDPQLAMARWGVALVNGPHINYPLVPPDRAAVAWQALTEAQRLASHASALERALIDALARRYANPQPEDRSPLDQAYASAMRELWRAYPDHAEVGTLCAEALMDLHPWNLWTLDGQPMPWTGEIVEVLERVLKINPVHPGANHLYIHAVEASPHPEKAEAAADRLRRLAPGASHLVHMPSHIYARIGRWDDAGASNLQAMEADAVYRALHPRPGFYAMYMAHNAHFYVFTAMMQGRSEEAIQHARRLVANVPEDFLTEYGPVADGFMIFVSEALMRFGRWEAMLAEPEPRPGLPLSRALWHWTRAVALTALHRLDEARQERTTFQQAATRIPHGYTFGNNAASNLVAIAALVLEGEMAAAEQQFDAAIAHLEEAVRREDHLAYDEPPDWIQPVRHTLGAVLLRTGRAAEAEAVYRADLARFPENGWSLFGLAQALKHQGKRTEADRTQRRFTRAWSKADVRIAATCFCQPGIAEVGSRASPRASH